MPNLLALGKLIFQLGDFAIKAIISYADTDEGAKEWGDVVAAFVELDLFNPDDLAQNVTVGNWEDVDKPLTDAELLDILEQTNGGGEQVSQGLNASPSRVTRMPHQHGEGQ